MILRQKLQLERNGWFQTETEFSRIEKALVYTLVPTLLSLVKNPPPKMMSPTVQQTMK